MNWGIWGQAYRSLFLVSYFQNQNGIRCLSHPSFFPDVMGAQNEKCEFCRMVSASVLPHTYRFWGWGDSLMLNCTELVLQRCGPFPKACTIHRVRCYSLQNQYEHRDWKGVILNERVICRVLALHKLQFSYREGEREHSVFSTGLP